MSGTIACDCGTCEQCRASQEPLSAATINTVGSLTMQIDRNVTRELLTCLLCKEPKQGPVGAFLVWPLNAKPTEYTVTFRTANLTRTAGMHRVCALRSGAKIEDGK